MLHSSKRLALAACAWLAPAVADAADLGRGPGSVKDTYLPTIQASPYNWTGTYGGVFVGGADQIWTVDFYRNNNHGHAELGGTGVAFGGWIGYNMMLDRNLVVGVETDLGRANTSQSNNVFDNDTSYSGIDTFGSIRGRAGYAVDNMLFYATAGLAYASITNDIQKGRNAGEQVVWDDKWATGYAIGAGLEYAFTSHMIGRIEYIYSNYGTTSLVNADGNLAEMTNEMHLVRAGLSYKF